MSHMLDEHKTYPKKDSKKLQATYGNTDGREGILCKVFEGGNNGVHGARCSEVVNVDEARPSGGGWK